MSKPATARKYTKDDGSIPEPKATTELEWYDPARKVTWADMMQQLRNCQGDFESFRDSCLRVGSEGALEWNARARRVAEAIRVLEQIEPWRKHIARSIPAWRKPKQKRNTYGGGAA